MGTSPDSIRKVGEADAFRLADVSRSTVQNWHAAGLPEPPDKLYGFPDVAALVCFSALLRAGGHPLPRVVTLWRKAEPDRRLASAIHGRDLLNVVICIDDKLLSLDLVTDADSFTAWVRRPRAALRPLTVLPVGLALHEASEGFWRRATAAAALKRDRRRAPSAPRTAAGDETR